MNSPVEIEEANYLRSELIKITQVDQAFLDDVVVDVTVLMHQHIAKPNCSAHTLCKIGLEHAVTAEHEHGVAIVLGGPQPSDEQTCCATSMHASMAVMNAYFTPRSHIWSARRSSLASASARRTLTSSANDRNRRRTLTSSTTADTLRELAVGSSQPRQFVEVDLPGCRDPPNPRHWVIVEQEPALDRRSSSQFERSGIQNQ